PSTARPATSTSPDRWGTMSDGDAKRSHVRIAAAILAAILVAATVFTYLAYTAAFTDTDTVTVTSPRAGLVMEQDAKVKYRSIQVGEVKSIEYAGDPAERTTPAGRQCAGQGCPAGSQHAVSDADRRAAQDRPDQSECDAVRARRG